MSSESPSSRGGRLGRLYRDAAFQVMNAVVGFALVNVVLYVVFPPVQPPRGIPLTGPDYEVIKRRFVTSRAFEKLEPFFPSLSHEDVVQLMLETYGRPFAYESFTEFLERPFHGRFYNVDPAGFRRTSAQGPWPPDPRHENVFVFGGSTTFGIGVPDDDTVPAALQEFLTAALGREVPVYNFGRGHYFSTQERVLFEKLLVAGAAPHVAVFLDGINDFDNATGLPFLTPFLRDMVDGRAGKCPSPILALAQGLPIGRLALRLRDAVGRPLVRNPRQEGTPAPAAPAPRTPEDIAHTVIARYLENKKMTDAVAAAYGVRTVFVLQPLPNYRYDQSYHLFRIEGAHAAAVPGYAELERRGAARELGPNFVSCAGIQEERREPLYVDQHHYSPAMSRYLARCIADAMLERGIADAARAD